jgi:uncharacterized protein (TIGR02646 family)
MEYFIRTQTPNCLLKKWGGSALHIRKGKAWKENYRVNRNANNFKWGEITINRIKHKLNELLVNELKVISKEHCFYCDLKNVNYGGVRPTIDHFYPKTKVPVLAYNWDNLFLACDTCQGYKGDSFNRQLLLKFDNTPYQFDSFFMIDFTTGKVNVRPDILVSDQSKALKTIEILGVNNDARPRMRIDENDIYQNSDPLHKEIDRFSYRYYIKRNVI